MEEVGGEIFKIRFLQFDPSQEVVISENRRDRRSDADGGCNQGFSNGAGDNIKACRPCLADVFEGMHDAPYRSKKADERGGTANTGENGEPLFDFMAFLLDPLTEASLEDVLAVTARRKPVLAMRASGP